MNPNPSKLFVGNLPFKTTRQELVDYFAQVGTVVDATILTDKYTGRSRGFGFVEMSTPEEAQKAKETLNDKPFMERNLIVNDAKPEEERIQAADMQPTDTTHIEPVAPASTPTEVPMSTPEVTTEAQPMPEAPSEEAHAEAAKTDE